MKTITKSQEDAIIRIHAEEGKVRRAFLERDAVNNALQMALKTKVPRGKKSKRNGRLVIVIQNGRSYTYHL